MAALLALLGQVPINFPQGSDDLEGLLHVALLLFGGGFFVALLGHLFESKTLLVAGLALFFGGTGVFFVAVGVHG